MERRPIQILIVHADDDGPAETRLRQHLQTLERSALVSVLPQVLFGMDRRAAADAALAKADLVLFLLSASFFDSDECNRLVESALERQHTDRTSRPTIIPVVVKPVQWIHSLLGRLAPLPPGGTAISSFSDQEQGYDQVVHGLREHVQLIPPPPGAEVPLLAPDSAAPARPPFPYDAVPLSPAALRKVIKKIVAEGDVDQFLERFYPRAPRLRWDFNPRDRLEDKLTALLSRVTDLAFIRDTLKQHYEEGFDELNQ